MNLEEGRKALAAFRARMQGETRQPLALLVEDNDSDRLMAEQDISHFNVNLVCVRTAREAIKELHRAPYDVALVDLRLATDSGLDVLRAAQTQDIRALMIVLTGADEHNPIIKEALDSGAQFVIRKPLTQEHLNLIFGTL